ncbi:uncharacterized protein BX663DRAFT_504089 [Cokeromyces recurvatus]|uniref:uncharacterized protein n=1 Tax=Cokeromyces recurvatus TaxID=90255 RepID=UPI002220AE7C|nr:uncharacterized protein BX663DRAFT_504089 [Cokeromyces recurvatus]KAI7904139.1 hypothetical protein BX663DRAFT_504089 [Cokeromyces recurvatus]
MRLESKYIIPLVKIFPLELQRFLQKFRHIFNKIDYVKTDSINDKDMYLFKESISNYTMLFVDDYKLVSFQTEEKKKKIS